MSRKARPVRNPSRHYQHFLETFEIRTMLSAAPFLPKIAPPSNDAPDLVATQDMPAFASVVNATVVGTFPEGIIPVPVPEGYNFNDWVKYHAATKYNGLTADMVTWTEIDGELRITKINTNSGYYVYPVAFGSRGRLTGSLDLSGCAALQSLDCFGDNLTALNLAGCTALQFLDCSNNQLTALNVSGCTTLEFLNCYYNLLPSLNVSGCSALQTLNCFNNRLTSLNLSGCSALQTLNCSSETMAYPVFMEQPVAYFASVIIPITPPTLPVAYRNMLTTLDLSDCPNLQTLGCSGNQLTTLILSECSVLQTLVCDDNQLTALDVANCTALLYLYCASNQLTTLDVSNCTALINLSCSSNPLTSLNVTGCSALKTLYCSSNRLPFSALPPTSSVATYYHYNNQRGIAPILTGSMGVDLSSEHNISGETTTYTWYYNNGNAVSTNNYTETDGTFTFHGLNEGDIIYCSRPCPGGS